MHRSLPIEAELSSPTKRFSFAGLGSTRVIVLVLVVVLVLEGGVSCPSFYVPRPGGEALYRPAVL